MTTSRLQIYNDALLYVGERSLASLTENREPRYLLDQVWNNDGVQGCLEEGQWFFAMRAAKIGYDTDITPEFGYANAFPKPTDWVRTCGLCSDEFFREPLLRYNDEAGYWNADLNTIYVRYVSNSVDFGMNLDLWPRSFAEFVAAHFAMKVVMKISGDDAMFKRTMALRERLKLLARSKSAMAEPTQVMPSGNWSRSRIRGYNRSGRDGGNTSGDLIP
jgi:hypothetical protein